MLKLNPKYADGVISNAKRKECEMLKDLIYLGVGSALLAKEKVEEELRELVEKGKVSEEEAKKLVDRAVERGEKEENELREKIKETLKEVIEEMGLATGKDIEELKKILEGEEK